MKTKLKPTILTAALATLLTSPLCMFAQDRYSIPADPSLKYSTPIAPGVAVPDKIESSIGTLNLTYGYPSAETVEKIYDNLDRSRALQAYLMAIPCRSDIDRIGRIVLYQTDPESLRSRVLT